MPHDLPSPELGVYTCSHVIEEGQAILHVSHDNDGDWQFLCGQDHRDLPSDSCRLVCLKHILARDSSLAPLVGKLCRNWSAWREEENAKWELQDDLEVIIPENIASFGWHVMIISGDAEGPGFAYSIGLFEGFGGPEILVVGLKSELMHHMINAIGERLKAGETFEAEGRYGGLLEGFDCAMRPVAPEHYRDYLGYARWYYQGDRFPVLHCIWPDKAGCFPWEAAFNPAWRGIQPDLG